MLFKTHLCAEVRISMQIYKDVYHHRCEVLRLNCNVKPCSN